MDITRLFLGVLIIGIVQFEETCSSVHAEGDMTRYDSECAPKNCSQSVSTASQYQVAVNSDDNL